MKVGSPQEQWLRADLASNDLRCTLAYWHKPRFSSGYYREYPSTGPFWAALYEFGAEVVIVGHDHNYERFAPQTPSAVPDPDRGIRQFVVGTGGVGLRSVVPPIAPNSELSSSSAHGVIRFALFDGGYQWEFIPVAGRTFRDAGEGSCH
jgi:hypothetical protein